MARSGAMLVLRQLRRPTPGALCSGAVCFICAATALPACRSHGTTTGVTNGAAPAQKHTVVLEHVAPKRDAPTRPPPSKLYRIGQTASTKDYRFRVEHTKRCETEPYFRPRPGNVKLGVEVTVESSAAAPVMINPFYACLRDSHGKSYYFTLAGCEPILQATRLEPEQKAEGWLTFEVPESANDLELSYGPPTPSGAAPEVRFSLRRE